MGMTIDEVITVLGMVEAHGICIEAKDIAVETMRKYQQLQAEYENRLKADMVAMLEELDLQIDEIPIVTRHGVTGTVMTANGMRKKIKQNIQQKIDALKKVVDDGSDTNN